MKIMITLMLALFLANTVRAQETETVNDSTRTTSSTFPKVVRPAPEDQYAPHVGLLIGTMTPEGDASSSAEFGVDVGYQPAIPFGLGVQLITTRNNTNPDENLDRNTLLARGTYNFGGDVPVIRESYVGLGLGTVFKEDENDLVMAPMLGFDIPLQEEAEQFISVGAHAKYMVVDGADSNALSLNGMVKYWF